MIITVEKNQNKKIKSIFIKTAILFFSVILFFIIAEIGCRLFYNESQNYDQRNWQAILSRQEKNKGQGGDP